MKDGGVLLVDDERSALSACSALLRSGGVEPITVCDDPQQVMDLVRETAFRLVLLDLAMPGLSGELLLEQLHAAYPWIPVVIMTAFNDADTAMRCIRAGAHDYLTKPLEKERLITTVRRVLATRQLQDENCRLQAYLLGRRDVDAGAFASILTDDECMLSIFQYTSAVAMGSEPVLITGETGTGKDLMARAIHTLSGRKGDYVALNTAGLDDQLFSDVLFGHVKGAYTGAAGAREGLLKKAAGGTIFLDEIGDISLPLQSALLRVIDNGEYYTGGSDTLHRADARIVVATNRDVHKLCEDGRMRSDLYYRLNVHHIHLPPLRDRSGDIGLLVQAFAAAASADLERAVPDFPSPVIGLMRKHDWSGNIRELKAVVTDAVSCAGDTVAFDWMKNKLQIRNGVESPEAHAVMEGEFPTIREATEALVRRAMHEAEGNQCRAARLLGISQPALSKRLKHITKPL